MNPTQQALERCKDDCIIVSSFDQAHELFSAIKQAAAIDFETVGFSLDDENVSNPRVRLTSICNDDVHFVIDHDLLGPLSDYADHFKDVIWYAFYSKFEIVWIDHACGHDLTDVRDVQFLKKAKFGGGPEKLVWMAKKDLDIDLDKDLQASDWSRTRLTEAQYLYSGLDSYVTWELVKHWWRETTPDQQEQAAYIFDSAVRATLECEKTGITLDTKRHYDLVSLWDKKCRIATKVLRRWTPPHLIENLNSDVQIGKFLETQLPKHLLNSWPKTEKTKRLQLESKYLLSVARRASYPFSRWLVALSRYKYYRKYLSTYGDNLIDRHNRYGKLFSSFNIAAARTTRFSSSNINLQNIPRRPVVRRSFIASAADRILCLADYSGIELRVLAELSGDKALLEDVIYGDVHSASASQIYDIDYESIVDVLSNSSDADYYRYKEFRSRAKGFTFQLLYGAGAGALSDTLKCDYEEAESAIVKWAAKYKRAYNYRHRMFDEMSYRGLLPLKNGMTIYVPKNDRSMPVAANYPIQGTAGHVILRAMTNVRELFIEQDLDAYLALTVHDELISDVNRVDADQAMKAQIKGMEQGWLDIFPGTSTHNLIEYAIGDAWSAKP